MQGGKGKKNTTVEGEIGHYFLTLVRLALLALVFLASLPAFITFLVQATEFCRELRKKGSKLQHLDVNTNKTALDTVLPHILAR